MVGGLKFFFMGAQYPAPQGAVPTSIRLCRRAKSTPSSPGSRLNPSRLWRATASSRKNLEYGQSKAVGPELGFVMTTKDMAEKKRPVVERIVWAYLKIQEELAASPPLRA